MRESKLQEVIDLIKNSNIAKFTSEDKIFKAVDNFYICNSKDELYKLYESKTGIKYDGDLKGFNNGGKNYFPPDYTTHAAVHETLHTLSSTFNKEGKRVKNGIEVPGTKFGGFVNEGISEYLTTKICNDSEQAYFVEVEFFKNIDENFSKYFESDMALENMYINNNTDMLKEFVDVSLSKENLNFEDICNNFLFYDKEKMNSITNKINKGANKILKKRDFYKKHPTLAKIAEKFLKKDMPMLNAPDENKKSENNIMEDLKNKVYKPGENNITPKETREQAREIEQSL